MVTKNEGETQKAGAKLWLEYKKFFGKRAVVFALEGKLGTGKTQWVKGLAKAMKIKDDVVSPTFTIEAEYDLGKLIHVDAWRIENPEELLEIGFEKRIKKKKMIVVEWADRMKELLRTHSRDRDCEVVWLRFKYGKDENERVIEITNTRFHLGGARAGTQSPSEEKLLI